MTGVCRKYGKLNHIVNNAGFTYDRMLHTTPDDAFDVIIKVHVRAPFRLVRAAAPYMRIKVGLPYQLPGMLADTDTLGQHREPLHRERLVDERPARERRPGELRRREVRRHRPHEDGLQGVGRVQRAREHGRLRLHPDTVSAQSTMRMITPHRTSCIVPRLWFTTERRRAQRKCLRGLRFAF